MIPFARIFLLLGITFLAIGGLLLFVERIGFSLNRLPGNIRFEGSNFTCLIGLGASLFLSIVMTLLLNLFLRWFGK